MKLKYTRVIYYNSIILIQGWSIQLLGIDKFTELVILLFITVHIKRSVQEEV
jgi:hypothetical protein